MPFTHTFMTQVLVFSGKEAEGLRGLGQAVPAAMPLLGGFGGHHEEGVLSCTSFLSRASSMQERTRGARGGHSPVL